jgi:hypothetical protein
VRITGLIFAAAVLASASVAVAQTDAPQAPTVEATTAAPETAPVEQTAPVVDAAPTEETAVEAAPTEPELICRTVSVRTESRLRSARQRVCRTQSQWDALDEQAQRGRDGSAQRNNN